MYLYLSRGLHYRLLYINCLSVGPSVWHHYSSHCATCQCVRVATDIIFTDLLHRCIMGHNLMQFICIYTVRWPLNPVCVFSHWKQMGVWAAGKWGNSVVCVCLWEMCIRMYLKRSYIVCKNLSSTFLHFSQKTLCFYFLVWHWDRLLFLSSTPNIINIMSFSLWLIIKTKHTSFCHVRWFCSNNRNI